VKVTTKTPEPVKPNVVIELTEYEARVLHRLTGRVAGPMGPAKTVTNALFNSLEVLGYTADPQIGPSVAKITSGVIKFEE